MINAYETSGTSPTPQTQSNWMTANEAAAYLSIKPATLLLWARQGKVKGSILSGTHRHVWRFTPAALDAMLSSPSIALTGGKH
ncbi:MAG TPA: helix-turn-helix domain-containing protein [Candidatus Dormibacteraeota bacterium]|jgi:hypothetical protein|nr:helix-turn-helix domain-containing protein [Candidatus Dormibacteraeota bacterium]